MLQSYPTEIGDAARIMLRKVKGEDVPVAEGVHACYQVLGVGLGQVLPDGPVVMDAKKKSPPAKGAKATKAAKAKDAREDPEPTQLPASKSDDWDRPDGMKCPVPDEPEQVLDEVIECCDKASVADHGVGAGPDFLDSFLAKQLIALAIKFLSDYLVK